MITSMPCPACGHEFEWDCYYAGKVLQCVACGRRFVSASPEPGQAVVLPTDATPREVITLDTLAAIEDDFTDVGPGASVQEDESGGAYVLTVLAPAAEAETCKFCGASVLPGVAVCGRCGLNPITGEEVPGFPPAVWVRQKEKPKGFKGLCARLWRQVRVRTARTWRKLFRRKGKPAGGE